MSPVSSGLKCAVVASNHYQIRSMRKHDASPNCPGLGTWCQPQHVSDAQYIPACRLDLLLPEKIWTRSLQLIEQGQVQCFVAQSSRRKVFLVSSHSLLSAWTGTMWPLLQTLLTVPNKMSRTGAPLLCAG